MTVASATSRNDYVGNGATATYSYTSRVFAAADLRVTKVDLAGVETTLVYLTDYTVTGVGSFSGGTITLLAGNLTSGHGLTIRFRSTLTQQTDIRNQSGFFPEVIEDALDRLTKLDQQQQDEVDRSIKLPETETGTMTIPTLALRRSSFLGFDINGNPIAGAALSSATPASVFVQTLLDDLTSGAFVETLRNALTAEAAPAVDDEVILRDTSVTLGKRMALSDLFKVITALTAETAPDAADELAIYDASAATADKITLANLLKVITTLTAETAPDVADELALYDASALTADKITLANLLKVVNTLTEDAAPSLADDYVLTYDTSAAAAKRVLLGRMAGPVSGTAVATTSGTSHDFLSIPAWVKRITFMYSGVSTNGTSIPTIQLGDSGGIETTGYLGTTLTDAASGEAGAVYTVGFNLSGEAAATTVMHGIATLVLVNAATNTWAFSVLGGKSDAAHALNGGGSKALSAALDRIRLTTVAGVDLFDAGVVNILYE